MTKRYEPIPNPYYVDGNPEMCEESDGEFVHYSDYAELVSATKMAIHLLEDDCRWFAQDELEEVLKKLGEEV